MKIGYDNLIMLIIFGLVSFNITLSSLPTLTDRHIGVYKYIRIVAPRTHLKLDVWLNLIFNNNLIFNFVYQTINHWQFNNIHSYIIVWYSHHKWMNGVWEREKWKNHKSFIIIYNCRNHISIACPFAQCTIFYDLFLCMNVEWTIFLFILFYFILCHE